MIDWTRIDELKEELGEEDFAEVFDIFLDEVQESVDSLEGVAQGAPLAAILHSVKGNAVTVGFVELAKLAGEGEQRAERNETVDTRPISTMHVSSKAAYAAGR